MESKTKNIYENKFLSEKLYGNEIVYSISVADIQEIANDTFKRDLDLVEIREIQKRIESGFYDWDFIIKNAIMDLESNI